MAALAADAGSEAPPAAPCSAEVMVELLERWRLPTDLASDSLRVLRCGHFQETLWHRVARGGRIDVLEYLKSKGLLDMIDEPDQNGYG